jgi:hypothetical protein
VKQKKMVFPLFEYLLIFFFISSSTIHAADEIKLHVPFRVADKLYRFKPLTKTDIKLMINGQPGEIVDLVEKEKSISSTPDLGRSFILSFHINEYSKKIADAVSCFATDVLIYSDMLFIVTPLSIYRVTVSRNKLKLIRNIEELVKRDCQSFNKKKIQAEKNLENMMSNLKSIYVNPYIASFYMATSNFLKRYPSEFMNYNHRYLLPDIGKYKKVNEFLGVREGERWCIHFQQREMYSLLFKTKQFFRRLKQVYAQVISMRSPITSYFSMFERELARLDSYPARTLLDIFLEGNINYNCIFFGSISERRINEGQITSPYLEKILKDTALASGGKAVETTNPLAGVRDIVRHQDHYYEAVFDFDGKIEEKHMQIILKGSRSKPSFREKFTKKELQSIIHYLSTEKVMIKDFTSAGRTITFIITSFELQERDEEPLEPFGILRVRIQLHNPEGERVYTSERILRTHESKDELIDENTVRITNLFPAQHKGKFLVIISITDLIRNSFTSVAHNIELKQSN